MVGESQGVVLRSLAWALCAVCSLSGCRPPVSPAPPVAASTTLTLPTALAAAGPTLAPDYSQPQNVLNLYYQLVMARRWEDAYSLTSRDSKAATKLGDFIQGWAVNEGRMQLVRFACVGGGQVTASEANLYCEADWDQVYPKISQAKTYFVRSLVREEGAWRVRWRGPADQFDLAHELAFNTSQEGRGLTLTLTRVALLQGSTMVFFDVYNTSAQTVSMNSDVAQLSLDNGTKLPLETVTESKLGPRTVDPGQQRHDVLIFQAMAPSTPQLTFVSPQFSRDAESWTYTFSLALTQK